MLRLSPPGFERLLQSPVLVATFGGGEANVAVSLAQFGSRAATSPRCRRTRSATRRSGRCGPKASAPTSIVRGGDRVGIYYAETGASQRASTVIYDRAQLGDQRDEARRGGLGRVFAGADWFHVTGITPALGANGAACTRGARGRARGRAHGQRRSQLPQEALDREAGAGR